MSDPERDALLIFMGEIKAQISMVLTGIEEVKATEKNLEERVSKLEQDKEVKEAILKVLGDKKKSFKDREWDVVKVLIPFILGLASEPIGKAILNILKGVK